MSLKYNKKLIPRAKELRNEMTKQEKHLWYDFLSDYPVRFQRQKTIGNFIADFYCHEAKLVVEVDGSHHYTEDGFIYDDARTVVLEEKFDLQVIRFSNNKVETDFKLVCRLIDEAVKRSCAPPVTCGDTPL